MRTVGPPTAADEIGRPGTKESDLTITDTFEALRARGLARSLRHFSTDFLGMAPNYAADRGLARCSAVALLRLYRRLGGLRQPDLQARAFNCILAVEERNGAVQQVRL